MLKINRSIILIALIALASTGFSQYRVNIPGNGPQFGFLTENSKKGSGNGAGYDMWTANTSTGVLQSAGHIYCAYDTITFDTGVHCAIQIPTALNTFTDTFLFKVNHETINTWESTSTGGAGIGFIGSNVYMKYSDNTTHAVNTHASAGATAIQFNQTTGDNSIIFLRYAGATTADTAITMIENARFDLNGNLVPGATTTYGLGSVALKWLRLFASGWTTYGSDFVSSGSTLNISSGGQFQSASGSTVAINSGTTFDVDTDIVVPTDNSWQWGTSSSAPLAIYGHGMFTDFLGGMTGATIIVPDATTTIRPNSTNVLTLGSVGAKLLRVFTTGWSTYGSDFVSSGSTLNISSGGVLDVNAGASVNVNGGAAHTGGTCSHWTNGLCDTP